MHSSSRPNRHVSLHVSLLIFILLGEFIKTCNGQELAIQGTGDLSCTPGTNFPIEVLLSQGIQDLTCTNSYHLQDPMDSIIELDAHYQCEIPSAILNFEEDDPPLVGNQTLELSDLDCLCEAMVDRPGFDPIACGCRACPVGSLNLFSVDCGMEAIVSVPGFGDCTSLTCDGICNRDIHLLPSSIVGGPGVRCRDKPDETNGEFVCTTSYRIVDSYNDVSLEADFDCSPLDFSNGADVLLELEDLDCSCESVVRRLGYDPIACGCSACPRGSLNKFGVDCGLIPIVSVPGQANCTSLTCDGTCNGDIYEDTPPPSQAPTQSSTLASTAGNNPETIMPLENIGGGGVNCSYVADNTEDFQCTSFDHILDGNGNSVDMVATYSCSGGDLNLEIVGEQMDNYVPIADLDCMCEAMVYQQNPGFDPLVCGCNACPTGSVIKFGVDCGIQPVVSIPSGSGEGVQCTSLTCDGTCIRRPVETTTAEPTSSDNEVDRTGLEDDDSDSTAIVISPKSLVAAAVLIGFAILWCCYRFHSSKDNPSCGRGALFRSSRHQGDEKGPEEDQSETVVNDSV